MDYWKSNIKEAI